MNKTQSWCTERWVLFSALLQTLGLHAALGNETPLCMERGDKTAISG